MSKVQISSSINGESVEILCEAQQSLMDILRDELSRTGTKEGCATGDCGACSVLIDGRLVCSCLVLGVEAEGFSLEDTRWGGHGVFTHFLLEGLKGAGDADGNGIVTFAELFEYVDENVREATNGRQNPQMSGLGDIPLAEVGAGGA